MPGSSPLARGLPFDERTRIWLRGIIPARAGFTRRGARHGRGAADHPRSRGVYAQTIRNNHEEDGSSPLARGLLLHDALRDEDLGIIPARAGFTSGDWAVTTPGGGSSPLARGLREDHVKPVCDAGIIPARAGFTQATQDIHGAREDHPRSRGVYSSSRPKSFEDPGSSPLARGLPSSSRSTRRLSRIIPARAGFTSENNYSGRNTMGSSPLARGLHRARSRIGPGRGIIPARAGFTRPRRAGRPPAQDHPRSRGVYSRTEKIGRARAGSSPLARGLREGHGVVRARGGIIPARAGFTEPGESPVHGTEDHPRSRGVYAGPLARPAGYSGSSPLARGLRPEGASGAHHGGIIPARAGFTGAGSDRGDGGRDHPRSRGVYLPVGRRESPGSRIIPARAGFTLRRRTGSSAGPDHPRSRGVYRLALHSADGERGSSPLARGLRRSGRRAPRHLGIIPARAGFT